MDQIRHNQGKPKLSYPFANFRSITVLHEAWSMRELYAEADLDAVIRMASLFLDNQETEVPLLPRIFVSYAQAHGLLTNDLLSIGPGFQGFLSELLPVFAAIADVSEYGETKYERGNYRKQAPVTQYVDSFLRHALNANDVDDESKLPHYSHGLWNLWQLMDLPAYRDDRLPKVSLKPEIGSE